MNLYRRQRSIFNPEHHFEKGVCIIGAGSVGSFTTLTLAKMGVGNISVYDFDTIEEHNIPNQFYRRSGLGKEKVSELEQMVYEFSGYGIIPHGRWHPKDFKGAYIVISAVDNMDTRLRIIRACAKLSTVHYFIDTRMSGESGLVYTLKMEPGCVDRYMLKWYPQKEVDPERCGQRAIIYNVLMIASVVCRIVRGILTEEEVPEEVILDAKNITLVTGKISAPVSSR